MFIHQLTRRLAFTLVALLTAASLTSRADAAARNDSVTVSISIRVGPIAEIAFPEGKGFEIRVPEPRRVAELDGGGPREGTSIPEAVRIPFVVRGNATAVVQVDASETGQSQDGHVTGVARMISDRSRTLSYGLDVRMTDSVNVLQNMEYLSSTSGRSTTHRQYVRAHVAPGASRGVISVIPTPASGDRSTPGRYGGSLNVTITATD